jgi:hypothetical protein
MVLVGLAQNLGFPENLKAVGQVLVWLDAVGVHIGYENEQVEFISTIFWQRDIYIYRIMNNSVQKMWAANYPEGEGNQEVAVTASASY